MIDLINGPLYKEDDVLRFGLKIATGREEYKHSDYIFHSLYGSSAAVLAAQFGDLQTTSVPGARLTAKENSDKGLRSFLIAHFWLWTRPKNVVLMSTRFGVCEDYCQGRYLWDWVKRIGLLRREKIRWRDRGMVQVGGEKFTVSLDGTDFKTWEPKHPTLPIDTKYASHKFLSAGFRYEIALSVRTGKCVWISGPHKAGKHDMTVFREGLKQMIQPGDVVIADRGYQTSRADESFMSTPNGQDSIEVARFKTLVRSRHETYNGRIKMYASMENCWKHGIEKHRWAFLAVATTVQYHLEEGNGLFEV